jgi:hypothetical protein
MGLSKFHELGQPFIVRNKLDDHSTAIVSRTLLEADPDLLRLISREVTRLELEADYSPLVALEGIVCGSTIPLRCA